LERIAHLAGILVAIAGVVATRVVLVCVVRRTQQ
jgi:hypothetical protein